MLTAPPPPGSGSDTVHLLAIAILIGAPFLAMVLMPQIRHRVSELVKSQPKPADAPTAERDEVPATPVNHAVVMDYSIYDEANHPDTPGVGGSP